MGRLDGKVALVTGAGGGIGREACVKMAREGASAVAVDVRPIEDPVDGTTTFTADVSSAVDSEAMIAFAEQQFGKLDVLFNNAGVMLDGDDDAVATEEPIWDTTMAINAKGVFFGCKYAIPALRRAGGGSVLDIGCGAGHDLELLTESGFLPVGLDPSATMIGETRLRLPSVPLVRGAGERLPFRDGALDGCLLERVLMHVDDPVVVLAEVARVVRVGGFLVAFEPDWTSFTIDGDHAGVACGLAPSRSSAVGGRLEQLVTDAGFVVLDVVTEDSRGYAMAGVPRNLESDVRRVLPADEAERWLATQRAREEAGTFRARWVKTLVVATNRQPAGTR